jgi:hypothetical protein
VEDHFLHREIVIDCVDRGVHMGDLDEIRGVPKVDDEEALVLGGDHGDAVASADVQEGRADQVEQIQQDEIVGVADVNAAQVAALGENEGHAAAARRMSPRRSVPRRRAARIAEIVELEPTGTRCVGEQGAFPLDERDVGVVPRSLSHAELRRWSDRRCQRRSELPLVVTTPNPRKSTLRARSPSR